MNVPEVVCNGLNVTLTPSQFVTIGTASIPNSMWATWKVHDPSTNTDGYWPWFLIIADPYPNQNDDFGLFAYVRPSSPFGTFDMRFGIDPKGFNLFGAQAFPVINGVGHYGDPMYVPVWPAPDKQVFAGRVVENTTRGPATVTSQNITVLLFNEFTPGGPIDRTIHVQNLYMAFIDFPSTSPITGPPPPNELPGREARGQLVLGVSSAAPVTASKQRSFAQVIG